MVHCNKFFLDKTVFFWTAGLLSTDFLDFSEVESISLFVHMCVCTIMSRVFMIIHHTCILDTQRERELIKKTFVHKMVPLSLRNDCRH